MPLVDRVRVEFGVRDYSAGAELTDVIRVVLDDVIFRERIGLFILRFANHLRDSISKGEHVGFQLLRIRDSGRVTPPFV